MRCSDIGLGVMHECRWIDQPLALAGCDLLLPRGIGVRLRVGCGIDDLVIWLASVGAGDMDAYILGPEIWKLWICMGLNY